MANDEPSGNWVKASIVWLEHKSDGRGGAVKEVIYELRDDPDLLRQLTVPESALYAGAKRGDKILIKPNDALIVSDDSQS